MKKALFWLLPAFTALAVVFTLGYSFGRSQNVSAVQLSIPETMLTAPAAPSEAMTIPAHESSVFPININTATAYELMALPNIGETIAGRIIAYREAHGEFLAVEELMNVEGIGEKRMEELLDLVTIGG